VTQRAKVINNCLLTLQYLHGLDLFRRMRRAQCHHREHEQTCQQQLLERHPSSPYVRFSILAERTAEQAVRQQGQAVPQ
jgi:hypothetical protein